MPSYFQRLFIGTSDEFANIELDARIVEQFDVSTTITDHPVDTGAVISDHAYLNPETYILEGVVSDTPMSVLAAARQIGSNVSNLLATGSAGIAGSFGEDPAPASKRSVAAFNSLLAFWRSLTVFNVQTAMGLKENLMIQTLTARVDEKSSNILRFTATLRQVPRVETSITRTENLAAGNVEESAGAIISEGVKQKLTSTTDTFSKVAGLFG